MTTKTIDKTAKSDRSAVAQRSAGNKTASKRDLATTTAIARKTVMPPDKHSGEELTSKQTQLLQLLNRPEGASIEDMMQATQWQQHSVRGFLAGTVKKKMGLALTSAKDEGDVRRYRIGAPRRGR